MVQASCSSTWHHRMARSQLRRPESFCNDASSAFLPPRVSTPDCAVFPQLEIHAGKISTAACGNHIVNDITCPVSPLRLVGLPHDLLVMDGLDDPSSRPILHAS